MSDLIPLARSVPALVLLIALFEAPSVVGQEALQTGQRLGAFRLSEEQAAEIEVDGFLNESFWEFVPATEQFRQREPREGEVSSERTEVRVAYDDEHLYVSVYAYDEHPDRIVSRILQRDQIIGRRGFSGLDFQGDDVIAILFDTFWDRRNGVVFATNPNGAEFEALITDEGSDFNTDWRGVWSVSAQRRENGWSAEFAIPFRTLRYFGGEGRQTWGFNVVRYIPHHNNEEALWSAWSRNNEGFLRVSRAGILDDLQDLPRSGTNIEVKPYLLSGGTQQLDASNNLDASGQIDLGIDAKWEVAPGLLLDLTVNTDFAQVESDDERINLTRFSLFFPEKREFFIENAGIFEFGEQGFGGSPGFLMFFSRRIGINDDGEVPVLGGARLTGRQGSRTVGFLNVVTDEKGATSRTNFAVARVKQDVGDRSYIGAMVTDRRQAGADNSAAGLDWGLWLSRNVQFQGYAARTITGGPGPDDNAYRASLDFTSDLVGFDISHSFIGREVNAEMGFVPRTDIRRTSGYVRVAPRPGVLGIRQIRLWVSGQYLTGVDGELQDWGVGPNFSITWNSGDNFNIQADRTFTRLTEEFNLPADVIVPVGDYDNWKVEARFTTSDRRPFRISAQAEREGFFGGEAWSLRGSLNLNPTPNLRTQFELRRNEVDLPGGSFVSNIAQLRLTYAFSTRLITNALVQYNSLRKSISTNVRINFIHRPGSDLFIVFNEERGSDTSVWDTESRGLVAKLTYLMRI